MLPQEHIIRRYFELMSASDIEGIIDLFSDDAIIHSPFLGQVKAGDFFRKLGSASRTSTLTVYAVLASGDDRHYAGHFRYDWELASGDNLSFEGVDLFEVSEDGKLLSMKIYYDTHPLREEVGDKYADA
ncbi:MAG: nuclear transport factor 2 family protein [Pseudomonadota bacterium]